MLVDIDRVIVGDRIRKDFGDIEELAEDIKENGLINPPVINKDYVLLAGERRLRACKSLGWNQIEVRMMDTRDAEHELNIEISENDVRKSFSKSERLDYIQRLYRIEQAKAAERQKAGTCASNDTKVGRSDEATAEAFGISATTMRRELYIDEHKELLDPADFADWDEGKLSTNKAFQKIKAAKAQAERELRVAEQERDAARRDLAEAYKDSDSLEAENASLRRQMAEKPRPEVVEREVVREVPPADYEETKRRNESLSRENKRLLSENGELRGSNLEKDRLIEERDKQIGERDRNSGANRDVEQLINNIYTFLSRHGGKSRAFDQFYRVDSTTQEECRKALLALGGFSQSLLSMTESRKMIGE